MGIGGSMLWWEEGFCRMLADGGRLVISDRSCKLTGREAPTEPADNGGSRPWRDLEFG